MADIWSSDYKNASVAPGIGNDRISCAIKTGTREVYWKALSGGENWSMTPVLAWTVPDGPLLCHTYVNNDGSVGLTNGIKKRRSRKYGRAGTWEND